MFIEFDSESHEMESIQGALKEKLSSKTMVKTDWSFNIGPLPGKNK